MKVLICVFLALAVDTINCHTYGSSWLSGGSPSYSYESSSPSWGSSIYGASYGSGLGYSSGGYGSDYGSSGISYGSSGYGSGLGYGSGSGLGGGNSYYTASVSPAVTYQTARYSYQQPAYGSGYNTYNDVPENVDFPLGGARYLTGKSIDTWNAPVALNVAQGVKGFEAPRKVIFTQDFSKSSGQFQRPQEVSEVLAFQNTNEPMAVISERISPVITEDIGSFHTIETHGDSGGVSGIQFQEIDAPRTEFANSGYRKTVSPAVVTAPKQVVRVPLRTTSVRQITRVSDVAPAKISFTQDFSGVAGQTGFQRAPGISSVKKEISPARVITQKHSPAIPSGSGFSQKTGSHGGHVAGIDFVGSGYQKTSPAVPAPLPKPANTYRQRVSTVHRGGQGTWDGSAPAPGSITFTQDFSRVTGQSHRSGGNAGVSAFNKVVAPGRTVNENFRTSSGRYGSPGAIRKSGFLGSAGPQISFIQGVSSVRGQAQPFGIRPETVIYGKVNAPVTGSISRQWTGQTGYRAPPQRKVQNLSPVAPSRITFTQDFSKIAGHQTSGNKPIVPNLSVPAFPGAISTTGYKTDRRTTYTAPKPAQRPITAKLDWKTPKQPITISREPGFTTIHDQSPAEEVFGGKLGGVAADRSVFTTGPITAERGADYKQEIISDYNADRQLNVLKLVPAVVDKSSSTYKQSAVPEQNFNLASRLGVQAGRDKSYSFVGTSSDGYSGGEKSSALLQSHRVNPAVSFVEDKGAILPAGLIDAALSPYGGQNQAGHSLLKPFSGYQSSSYPGYSQLSGESSRFGFSPDRSLLYSYDSPNIVSPFSYVYSSGNKGQYQPIDKKAA